MENFLNNNKDNKSDKEPNKNLISNNFLNIIQKK